MTFDDAAPIIHGTSVLAILGAFAGWVPPIAAALAALWYSIEIYESKTFQRILADRRTRKVIRLRARILMLEQLSSSTPGPHPPANDPSARRETAQIALDKIGMLPPPGPPSP